MAKIINVGILLLVVASSSLAVTEAAEYIVPWIIPITGGASFYSNLFANTTFRLNDILGESLSLCHHKPSLFNFTTGSHNVVTLSKKNFEDCNVKEKMESFNTGPARIKLNGTGEFYFACAFPSHCILGQKLSINVTASSSSSSPAGAPAEAPSSQAGPGAPAEAPSSQAGPGAPMSVTATFSSLLMAIAINVLF